MSQVKKISIACPIHNEEDSISHFYIRYLDIVKAVGKKYNVELIFSNNRSEDNSLAEILKIRETDSSVQVITLSRNFGYQASLQALLSVVDCDALIFIDVDCEDPPEMILDFINKWEEGYNLVYGIRVDRVENFIIKKMRKIYYRILKKIGDADIILYMAEFSLISKEIQSIIKNKINTFPYIRAEISYAGFSRIGIEYKRDERAHGKTHYNIISMFSTALSGILTSSTFPMRLGFYLIPVILTINIAIVVLGELEIINHAQLLIMAMNFSYFSIFLGFYGLYIARIYKNLMGRPLFIIDYKLSSINN